MSRQDKATTDRNARILRDLVKQPDNKSCADCRKNDARWASWNLGVFLCIRCSGIHRSMGTHISKVKSIDLDIWTPEQMDSIQKWGNRRANLYWEKHLKAGHVPPEHKIESFIRSKYESKRWAMDGPPPSDPASLEGAGSSQPVETNKPTPTTSAPVAAPGAKAHPLLSRTTRPAPPPTLAPVIDLFGGDDDALPTTTPAPQPTTSAVAPAPQATTASNGPAPTPTAQPAPAQPAQTGSNIFDLDFRAPTPTSRPQTAKADIMSLFSSTSPSAAQPPPQQSFFSPPPAVHNPPAQNPYSTWGGGITSSAPPTQHVPAQSNIGGVGGGGGGGWGGIQVDQSAWGAPQAAQSQQVTSPGAGGGNVWGGGSAGSADPWASNGSGSFGYPQAGAPQKKEEVDPFANIWK